MFSYQNNGIVLLAHEENDAMLVECNGAGQVVFDSIKADLAALQPFVLGYSNIVVTFDNGFVETIPMIDYTHRDSRGSIEP